MTDHSPSSIPSFDAPASIAVLRCHELGVVDPMPVMAFAETHSPADVENMICRALEDIAIRLDRLQAARQATAYDQFENLTRRISVIAAGLGLTEVSRAACHTGIAAGTRCGVAVAATLARLERSFDAGISAVRSVQRMPG